ncbi:MAG: TonB-dependent receptor plug domain-containing protein [Pseudohongiellaceae bacterium]
MRLTRISETALCVAIAALTTLPVTAAENETLRTITVSEIMPVDLTDTPGAAARLTEEQIAAWRPYTLHDALSFIAGVRTIDDDVLGRRSAIGVRGAPARRSRKTLLLEDGTPINFSSYLDPSTHYTPPMERLESIDVLKGAGHVLHGPLNNHGIINFRNKKATVQPQTDVEVAFGNLDTFKRHLMHRRTEGDLGMVFSYTGANADGSFDVEGFQYDDLYASAEWDISDGHDLAASFTWFRERSNYDESNLTPQEYEVAPRTKLGRFGQEYNTFALNYYKADLSHDWQLSEGLSLTTRVFGTDADRPRFTVEPEEIAVDALPDIVLEDPDAIFMPGVQGEMISRDRYYRTYGIESRMEKRGLDTDSGRHTLQWGMRFERHFLDDMRRAGGPGEVLTEGSRGPLTRDVAYQATAVSAFFQDVIRIDDWLVTPGVRIEDYQVNKVRHSLANDPGPHGAREEDNNFLFMPSISVLYEGLGDDTQLFANVAQGYTPAFARTAEGFPLEPETGINSQVGLRSTAIGGISLDTAVFYNQIKDTIVQLPFTSNGMNIYLNSADSRSYGMDFSARWESAPMTRRGIQAYIQPAYSYTRAEFTEDALGTGIDGNRVPEVPLRSGSLTFGLSSSQGLHLSLTASHFGNFFTDPTNTRAFTLADEDREPVGPGDALEIREPAVLGQVPSYTLYSASVSFTPTGGNWTVWLQGRNLADKLYITDLENGIRPGAERTVTGGVRFQF